MDHNLRKTLVKVPNRYIYTEINKRISFIYVTLLYTLHTTDNHVVLYTYKPINDW